MPAVTKRSSDSPVRVEDADGGVARPGHLARDVEQLLQDRLELELGDQDPARVDQAPEAEFVEERTEMSWGPA